MIFSRFASTKTRSSAFALALALATGTAMTAVAIEAPAEAQRKKKKKEEAPKADYSKAFVETYQPLNTQVAEGGDPATLKAGIPAVIAAIETADDRMAAGSLIFSIGQKANDPATQSQGVEMMLASGKVPAANLAQYNFLAGQLAYNQNVFGKAREFVQAAFDLGYTQNDPQAIIAETYFAEDKHAEGLSYLDAAIKARQAAGQEVSQSWVQRGVAIAYNNQLVEQARAFSVLYASDFPSNSSWGDAIAIALNTSQFEYPEILDLLRLARRTGTMRDANMYMEYIEAADARRNPSEVTNVIDEGYAAGLLDRGDSFVSDSRAQAAGRIAADKADLPALGRDARAASATLRTVMAAGDAYLSYDRGAEAEEFFAKALGMPGVNMPLALTRLGIAQLDQGKFAEAAATFGKVEGERETITNLYAAWADQQGAAQAAPATATPAAPATEQVGG
ncbi:hypothetical protein ACRAQ7_12655 [Erythrobacter sp. W53]|uniref:hypothetical protein n=1 Tax=Erythrobacter sp. W53 TaxID=3425947 RepID=UPI003D768949